ncbi:MAG: IgA Peptidase M64 [Ignavibacteria bacterium]|nr:MAG: IgA Peptidase M64 [Ignavibacteria bacterium]
MKNIILLLIAVMSFNLSIIAQNFETFNKYFIDKTMRIDYYHIGDADTELITVDQVYQYGIWAGSRVHLIDNFNNGRYYIKIYDAASGELIFSKGFDSYFGEYKTSTAALDGIKKTFHESALIPYPNSKIIFALEMRDDKNLLNEFFRREINPDDVDIRRDDLGDLSVMVFETDENGDPHKRVDVVILGEGYTRLDKDNFLADLAYFKKVFLNMEPFQSNKNNFNFYGVLKTSVESGTDEPRAGIFKNTVLNSTFNSMGTERYLLTEDNKTMRDLAANVPYDAIYIMVNSSRYGGGGIYNLFSTFTSDNQWKDYVFLHEFGHSFAGLADEYYTSSTAYNDFYKRGVEPVEPNITALLDPQNLKWKEFVSSVTAIPTPWEKAGYDSMDYKWQNERSELNNKISELKKSRAPADEILRVQQEYDLMDKIHANKVDEYLQKSKFKGIVGAFEGAGYSSQGLYRPMLDCIMFSKGVKPFGKVCEQAIRKVIDFYTE